jgi:hypothetical protein
MVLSCRHCYSPHEFSPCSNNSTSSSSKKEHDKQAHGPHDHHHHRTTTLPSYMGMFVYGHNQDLLRTMEMVETKYPPIPGISSW